MPAFRWSLIASHLPGRTDNEIKNHWNSHLSRQIHTYRRKYTAGPDNTITIDTSKLHSADKRRGGRTPGRSPRSATTSSRKSKSKQPDPEPEPESGDAKGASSPATVTIDMSKLRSDDKRRGDRTPGRSPKSATSSSTTKSNQPDPEPEPESGDAKGASSPATAATLAAHSDGARSGSGSEGPCSDDATRPWVLNPIELPDLWEAESDIDALMSIGAGHDSTVTTEGLEFDAVIGEAQVDDLFDMDWDGFAAHLWGGPEQNDQRAQLQLAAEPQAAVALGCAVVDPDPNQPNSSSGSTAEGPFTEDATGPWVLDPIELGDLWEAESEIDALMSSTDAALEGFDAVGGEAQVDDLFDMDMDWDGFAAHLWGGPEHNDHSAELQQAAEPQAVAATCTPDEHEFEAFETWLLSDSF
ncbi:unnamed protein product [Miscanthus lutarioriparius]|uniref:Uncharacterized protein n=1 Tax=Miscanthus lutarioriparius TaxID=422564 RepID=A0A811ME63_9POAL|nr:unnamed protein product [Miscanthus lutarioriparius]